MLLLQISILLLLLQTGLAQVGHTPGKSKEELAKAFSSRLESFSRRDIIVYTDGSLATDGSGTSAGAGWVGYQAARRLFRGAEPLGAKREVFDIEAQAAYRGLREAIKASTARMADNVHICLDNLAVTVRLCTKGTGAAKPFSVPLAPSPRPGHRENVKAGLFRAKFTYGGAPDIWASQVTKQTPWLRRHASKNQIHSHRPR